MLLNLKRFFTCLMFNPWEKNKHCIAIAVLKELGLPYKLDYCLYTNRQIAQNRLICTTYQQADISWTVIFLTS